MIDIPHFQELLEEAKTGFLEEDHWDMISCQNAIPQFFRKSVPPIQYQKREKKRFRCKFLWNYTGKKYVFFFLGKSKGKLVE